ncbi:MAG: type secretion ATPase, ClpV1 family, partial [Rhodoferax sp.]|nr:type secretion ATPase, ClpV1 family [Rhodoferax sp.]
IIAHCGTHETGARRLIGFIEQHLLPRLARLWLNALQDKRQIFSIHVDVPSSQIGGAEMRPDAMAQEGEAITCEATYH